MVLAIRIRRWLAEWRVARYFCAISLMAGLAASSGGTVPDASFFSNFRDAALSDQAGRPFQLSALRGHVTLFSFVFTGCSSTCPLQTRALVEVRQALPAPVLAGLRFVSVSIDPLNDSPAALASFAQRMGADVPDWSFVTGSPRDIERISTRLRLMDTRRGPAEPRDHSTGLWLVDGSGRLMQRYSGNPPDVQKLVRELRQLHDLNLASPPAS